MDIDTFILTIGAVALALGLVVREPYIDKVTVVAAPEEKTIQVDQYAKDKHCLAVMVYGEARGESFYGKSGVAWSALNRYDHLPYTSMCDIVLDSSQYNALRNNTLRVSAVQETSPKGADVEAWEESKKVAELAWDKVIPDPTKGATHFVNPRKLKTIPRWVRVFRRTVTIENHQFYKNV